MMPALQVRSKYIWLFRQHNAIKDPQRYAVQEGDARMMHTASQPGQKNLTYLFLLTVFLENFTNLPVAQYQHNNRVKPHNQEI